jgi:Tol biopolymer transport system component/predicted Ser/Thr protein kinase
MGLTAGTRLGPYEIQSPLGAGGMGEVYRARDTRLDRTVAVKILPAHLSASPEARQRFDREARAISALNHPNICTLYDVGHQDGMDFLVMEYLEGETLADRLGKGPLPPDQVLKHGVEICEGLEKAHKSGVVHRDLKPGNIMLTKTGAKLMDFGLAKATAAMPLSSSLTMPVAAPAQDRPLTAQGMLVGTFQYMSPEQVEGKEADARSDIFSLGAVLYEMATAKRAFSGKSQASVIAAILDSDPPPISTLQPVSPPALDRVVSICLAKDRDERWQTAHDVKLQLRWIAAGGSQAGLSAPFAVRRSNRERFAWIVASLALLMALGAGLAYWRTPRPELRALRSSILPPDGAAFLFLGANGPPIISPDGRQIAFVAVKGGVRQLWVRPLDLITARPLAGTDEAYGPFWSPDSRNLGFFAQGKLKRVPASGGPAVSLCDVDLGRGGTWNAQDLILFGKYPGEIYRVSAAGGAPQKVTTFDPERHDITHRWPYFLPDGNHFLYMAGPYGSASEENVVYLGTLDGKTNRLLLQGGSTIAYANGYVLYVLEKTLMARPFDPLKLDFTGEALPVAEGVQYDALFTSAVFSVSQNGVLLYQTGVASSNRTMTLFDPSGKLVRTLDEPGQAYFPRFSPDGKRLAYYLIDSHTGKSDIWIEDLASGSRTRLTVDPMRSLKPVWSRDGARVAYYSTRSGRPAVYVKPVSGLGVEQKVWQATLAASPNDWTLDSKMLILQQRLATGLFRLALIPVDGKSEPAPLLEVQGANLTAAELSSDGRWIAYESDESGKPEIYVSRFPKPLGSLQISLAGGRQPHWRRDGKELFYFALDGKIAGAELRENNGSLEVVASRTFFDTKATPAALDSFDILPDGKEFLVDVVTAQETPAPLILVQNWTADLKK